jgi:arylamine N-acetyltransferase
MIQIDLSTQEKVNLKKKTDPSYKHLEDYLSQKSLEAFPFTNQSVKIKDKFSLQVPEVIIKRVKPKLKRRKMNVVRLSPP